MQKPKKLNTSDTYIYICIALFMTTTILQTKTTKGQKE